LRRLSVRVGMFLAVHRIYWTGRQVMVGLRANGEKVGDEIEPVRLSDVLYDRLVLKISQGEFSAGSRLPSESDLAERFNVSRSMVREALLRLRENRVIVSRKGAGSFVLRQPGTDERTPVGLGFAPTNNLAQVKKCYEFRIGVEGEAAFWAAQNRTSETLARIRLSLDQLETAIAQGAIGVEPDYNFHLAVAQASANEFFETVLASLKTTITFAINLSRSLSLAQPVARLRVVQEEHIAIYDAIEAGDKEGAAVAMRCHISNTCDRVFEGAVYQFGGPLRR
jgi:DNA-binding FadR family transcriptional regulator